MSLFFIKKSEAFIQKINKLILSCMSFSKNTSFSSHKKKKNRADNRMRVQYFIFIFFKDIAFLNF